MPWCNHLDGADLRILEGQQSLPGAPTLRRDPLEDGDINVVEAIREARRATGRRRAHDRRPRDQSGEHGYFGRLVHGGSVFGLDNFQHAAPVSVVTWVNPIPPDSRDGFVLRSGRHPGAAVSFLGHAPEGVGAPGTDDDQSGGAQCWATAAFPLPSEPSRPARFLRTAVSHYGHCDGLLTDGQSFRREHRAQGRSRGVESRLTP